MKTVWIRHGQSEYNAQGIDTGWPDPDLTEQGVLEAQQAGSQLFRTYPEIEGIYSSDLRRAHQTANYITDAANWSETLQVSPAIRDRDFGDWSGKPPNDEWKKWLPKPENGESMKECAARVYGFLKELESNDSGLPHIIVCHNNTIRAASVVIGINAPEDVQNFDVLTGEIIEWVF